MGKDYSQNKNYLIKSPNTDKVYVGSTTLKYLSQRLAFHVQDARPKSKKYCSSKKILECGDYYIELIENFPCSNIAEQRKREGYWQDVYKRQTLYIIMPPLGYSFHIPSTLAQLASGLNTASNSKSIYLYKDSNGSINVYPVEEAQITSSLGYAYQFIDGSVSYSTVPITSNQNIAWSYPYTTLTASSANLYNSALSLWLDANETKSISTVLQRWVSKDYANNLVTVENTTNVSFTYTSPYVDLTTGSDIETSSTVTRSQYWKVCITCSMPTFSSGKTIFQHNRISIRMISHANISGTTTNQIALYDNGTYIKGLTITAGSTIYSIYADNADTLIVNNLTSNMPVQASSNYYSSGTSTIYIGTDSTHSNPSAIKVYEVLYYQSSSNNISATSSNIMTYLKARWSWTDYTSADNVVDNPYLITGVTSVLDFQNIGDGTITTLSDYTSYRSLTYTPGGSGSNPIIVSNTVGATKALSFPLNYKNLQLTSDVFNTAVNHSFTWIFMYYQTSNVGDNMFRSYSSNGRMYDWVALSTTPRINFVSNGSNGYADTSSGVVSVNNWQLITVQSSGSGSWGSVTSTRVNGVVKAYSASSGTPTSNADFTPQTLYIFPPSSGTLYIGGMITANVQLSATNINEIEGWMCWRVLGSGSILDAGHPYKNSAPTSFTL